MSTDTPRIVSSTPPSTPSRTAAPAPASTPTRGPGASPSAASAFLDDLLPSRSASPAPHAASSRSRSSSAAERSDAEAAAAPAESSESVEVEFEVDGSGADESWADEVNRLFDESMATAGTRLLDVEVEVELSREEEEEGEEEAVAGQGHVMSAPTLTILSYNLRRSPDVWTLLSNHTLLRTFDILLLQEPPPLIDMPPDWVLLDSPPG
ncbi:hypothetical protein JCM8208_000692 [Rhodotorula glutinis]